MNDRRVARPGFTLIDFILYFGLIGVFLVGVIGFTIDYTRSYNKAVIVSRVEQESRFAMLRILRAIRQASRVNTLASIFDYDAGTLALDTAATSTSPTVFDISNGAVRITTGPDLFPPSTLLTTSDVTVQKLRFTKDAQSGNTTAVTIEMTVAYAGSSADALLSYSVSSSGTAVVRKD